jgi:DNA (cytosine-5)-methyltransferase 1
MSAPLAFYNELDPDAAHVLRHLIADGVIAPGVVDTRSIKDLTPDDLAGFTQCHFFAGGGLWSVAARLAGWPDDRPLWTGSCPCQPFSAAGKGGGVDDPRHLWPDFFRLIRACRPPVVMGEQVAGAPGYGWFDGVRSDLAGEDYASRCVDIPACAVDAPHIRQRLYWIAVDVADSRSTRLAVGSIAEDQRRDVRQEGAPALQDHAGGGLDVGDAERRGCDGARLPDGAGPEVPVAAGADGREPVGAGVRPGSRSGSFWSDAEWLACHDGKARRTQPGLRLLVDGLPGRVGLWRVAGNAIVAPLAAEVIAAFLDAE